MAESGMPEAMIEKVMHDDFARRKPEMSATLLELVALGDSERRIVHVLRRLVAAQGIDPDWSWLCYAAECFVHVEIAQREAARNSRQHATYSPRPLI